MRAAAACQCRALAFVTLAMFPFALRAQGGVLVQGIADVEFWSTDSGSNLLTRNFGRPGALGRLDLWGAAEPWRGMVFYAQGEAAGGPAQNSTGRIDAGFEQLGVRYSPSTAFVLDLGKMPGIVGTFAARRFSTRNPLIGLPDGYPIEYPVGVEVSGSGRHFDYRVAAVSLPVFHPGYVPDPTAALRPAIGAGFTPFTGLRVGGSATWGPYLNASLPATLLDGQPWQHYQQRIGALDLAYSHDYLEVHAEWARGSYDVPTFTNAVSGETWYVEGKYTFGARLFVALRAERNDYPFIRPASATVWTGRPTDFDDGEFGVGYRVNASLLTKVSYRLDQWHLTPAEAPFLGSGGHALAVQLSQAFDVLALFDRTP
jgi:hypothetical protein